MPLCGQVPLRVTFTDESTPAEGITYWSWDFGDGTTSEEQNPVHTYSAVGYYTVTLHVASAKGIDTFSDYISVMSVAAEATPNPVALDAEVTFSATASGGVAPYTYLWDFGDALPTVETTDLYGYWPLDEASGNPRASILGTAPDLAEDGGAVSEVAGRFTNAITNTEVNPGPALEAALAPALGIATGLTVAFWFNMPAWTTAAPKTLFTLRNAGVSPYLHVYRYYDSDFLDVGFAWGATYLFLPLPRLGGFTEGNWHLLVVRYDATTGKLEGMVDDGCFASAVDWTAAPFPAEKLSATVPPADLAALNAITFDAVTVGKAHDGNFANGGCALDDLRIWTRALTDAEVADLWYQSDEDSPVYSYGESGAVIASVTATSATGCEVSGAVSVTVNP